MAAQTHPPVWAVVLGYGHPDDTVECLQSLQQSDYPALTLLYTDNGSDAAAVQKVMAGAPFCRVARLPRNVGVSRGFNAGIAHALSQGAACVLMINNDTKTDAQAVSRLVEAAGQDDRAGLLIPKILYYAHPDVIWSAGSRYRRFPPAIIMQKTRGPDDGRYDGRTRLEFTTLCAALLRRSMLEDVGLLDTTFWMYAEDYDLSLRARARGYGIRLVPDARIWHKVSKSVRMTGSNPTFWRNYGRSEEIFRRKHGSQRWLTGRLHRLYVVLRFVAEGHYRGFRPFLEGVREGRRTALQTPPKWNGGTVDPVMVLR
jgi:GT2 family glycosyltransferase